MTRTETDPAQPRIPASILGKMALSLGSVGLLLAAGCSEPAGGEVSPVVPPIAQPAPDEPGVPAALPEAHGSALVAPPQPAVIAGCKPSAVAPEPSAAGPETAPQAEPVPVQPDPVTIDNCPWCGRG